MTLDHPDIEPVGEGRYGRPVYRLEEEFIYYWTHEGIDWCFHVPRGFLYDGASVPRIAWSLSGILPDGLNRTAALIHDFLYQHKGRLPANTVRKRIGNDWFDVLQPWQRVDADKMFGRLLREAGITKHRRRRAYLAVRAFGWMAWKT